MRVSRRLYNVVGFQNAAWCSRFCMYCLLSDCF